MMAPESLLESRRSLPIPLRLASTTRPDWLNGEPASIRATVHQAGRVRQNLQVALSTKNNPPVECRPATLSHDQMRAHLAITAIHATGRSRYREA